LLNTAVNATRATRVTNLLNREIANTRAAAETVQIPVIIIATPGMVHSPAITAGAVKKAMVVNRLVITGEITAAGTMAAIANIVTTEWAGMDMAGIVFTAAIIAGNGNTEATGDFGYNR
jgi:hypothetical protein